LAFVPEAMGGGRGSRTARCRAVLVVVRCPEVPDAAHGTPGQLVFTIKTLGRLDDRGVDGDGRDAMQRDPTPQHAAMFGGLIPLGRRWLESGVAIGHSGVIPMPLEQMRRRQYQAVISVV
jgi:hypothetical protein